MRKTWVAALMLVAVSAAPSTAGNLCDVPVALWRPRQMLRLKLQAEGWTVRSIKTLDGCYVADAVDASGAEVHALFDPGTFARVLPADRRHAG